MLGLVCVSPAHAAETDSRFIRIVYPAEKASLPAIDRIFVFGSVYPPDARVSVNGLDSPVSRSALGGWLMMVPLKNGKMTLTAAAVWPDGTETSVVRKVTVGNGASSGPSQSAKKAGPTDRAVQGAPGEKVWKPFRVGRILTDTAYLRSGPDMGDEQAGFELPLAKNVLVTIVGQVDKSLHVRLSDLESVWIEQGSVKLLPKQTPVPQSLVNAWTIRRLAASTILQTKVQEYLPYRVTAGPDGRSLTLKIYGGVSNTDWIHFAADDPWVRQARWSHPMEGVYQIDVDLRRPVWGFEVRYENGKLLLELRDPPAYPEPVSHPPRRRDQAQPVNPLAGVNICLDPGHPPMGATGPLGTTEHRVNWLMASTLRDVLADQGSQIVMSREEGETVALPDRVIRAKSAGSHLFISIHANALPPSDNPFEKNGFSVYYFQPFSQPLAESVFAALRENIPLRDDGLHYGNLHVLRQSSMPAILIECAYLMWPPEEELLLDPEFRYRYAESIASGIRAFLERRHTEDQVR